MTAETSETSEALAPIRCERCHRRAVVDHVTLEQNIGALVLRFPSRVRGTFCRSCISRAFWRCTLVTLVLGWWGIVSFFVTFAVLYRNLQVYRRSRALPPPAPPSEPGPRAAS